MTKKDIRNYVAKKVAENEDGKPIVQLYLFHLKNSKIGFTECKDLEPIDYDIAKKEYSLVGLIP